MRQEYGNWKVKGFQYSLCMKRFCQINFELWPKFWAFFKGRNHRSSFCEYFALSKSPILMSKRKDNSKKRKLYPFLRQSQLLFDEKSFILGAKVVHIGSQSRSYWEPKSFVLRAKVVHVGSREQCFEFVSSPRQEWQNSLSGSAKDPVLAILRRYLCFKGGLWQCQSAPKSAVFWLQYFPDRKNLL